MELGRIMHLGSVGSIFLLFSAVMIYGRAEGKGMVISRLCLGAILFGPRLTSYS